MNYHFISQTPLFRGCSEEDIQKMEKLLHFRVEKYNRNNTIMCEGDIVTDIGLVLSGSVQIVHNDLWGNKSILGIVETGGVFAEAYACISDEPMMIDVIANEDCEILFIHVPELFEACADCKSKSRLVQNLVTISARKNLQLSRRSLHTSPKTIRGRLLSYFSQEICAQGSNKITIPFDRQQMADYLNLDRSALSKELGKMKKEGLIEFRKKKFEIKVGIL